MARGADAGAAVHNVGEVELLAPVPTPESVRDAMSFERHVLQATRVAGLAAWRASMPSWSVCLERGARLRDG